MHIEKVSVNNLEPYLDKYEHFSFDLWLTLIRSNPVFKAKRNELFKAYFELKQDIETVSQTIRYYDVLSNKVSEKTGLHIHKSQIYFLVLNALQVDIMALSEEDMQGFYKAVDELFLTYPPILLEENIVEVFQLLHHANKTTNILSNTAFIDGKLLQQVLALYGIKEYFTFQLYSDETGLSKPNAEFFQLVYENITPIRAIDKQQILHVGDNPYADILGAKNAGFDSLLIKN